MKNWESYNHGNIAGAYDREKFNASVDHMELCRFLEKAIILDPNERVINIERVRELASELDDEHMFNYEPWKELKKELGLGL